MKRVIEGHVVLTVRCEVASPSQLVLDSRDLALHSVKLFGDSSAQSDLKYELGEVHAALGTPVRIALPPGAPAGRSGVAHVITSQHCPRFVTFRQRERHCIKFVCKVFFHLESV